MSAKHESRAAVDDASIDSGAVAIRPTILVVDDEPGICALLQEALERHGHRVTVCGGPEEALAAATREYFGVVLLDVMMPAMNGYELLRALRERLPRAVFVMMTGYPNSPVADSCLQDGAMLCLPKPVRIAGLLDLLANLHAEA